FFTTKPVGVGTGLGLSISRGIVTSFGGSMSVSSTVGAGTTFQVRIPIADAPKEPTGRAQVHHPEPAARPARVLVVDDEQTLGVALKRALKPHQVTCAADGVSALSMLREKGDTYDLVLCDLMMPGMCGDELFVTVRREAPDI